MIVLALIAVLLVAAVRSGEGLLVWLLLGAASGWLMVLALRLAARLVVMAVEDFDRIRGRRD